MKRKSLFLVSCLLISIFSGCATVPKVAGLPGYNINGLNYFPLFSFCESKGIEWQYDTFTKTVVLRKNSHRINLILADTLVLVDGQPIHLRHPVDIYQGVIVAPDRFREELLDSLFKETPSSAASVLALRKIKKVVIDAGHGGSDPGAIGRTGLREKDVNLDIAKRLSGLLKSRGIETVMTRSTDRFVPLAARVEITNCSGADLFISIHSNANRLRSLNGFEVYYVASSVDDSKRALNAARNMTLRLDNASFAANSLDLKATVWDMLYASSRAEAIELSRSLCRTVRDNLEARVIGVKGARFEVLRGTSMPAVLVETGFLSNYKEERMLKNGYYRQKIAECIADGIRNYAQDL